MADEFRLTKSSVDESGFDVVDPDGNRVAWGRGEYAIVVARAINRYIDGDAVDRPAPTTARDLCLRLANTAMRLADSLTEFPDDPSASAEWIQALGDAALAFDQSLRRNVDELTPPAREGTYSHAILVGSGPRPPLVLEDDQPAPTDDRLALLRLHLERRCFSAPAEVAEVFAEVDRLTAELDQTDRWLAEAEADRNAAQDALTAAEQREAAMVSALEHIETITAPEMEPLYSVRPMPSAAASAHKIAKVAVAAYREMLAAPAHSDQEAGGE